MNISKIYLFAGTTSQDMAVSSDLFKQRIKIYNPKLTTSEIFDYSVNLEAINGLEGNASTKMSIKINKPPVPGSCSVSPRQGVAFEDKFYIDCWDWTDPEGVGIK